MTTQAKSPSGTKGMDSFIPSFGANLFDANVTESYAQAGQSFLQQAFSLNQKIMQFAGERFQKDVATLQAMSGCRTWQDAVELQTSYFQSATEDYQAEMKKLWEQGARATSEATEKLAGTTATTPDTQSDAKQK